VAKRTWKASLETKEDLREIALYTKEQWGIAQKNAYLKAIKIVFARLAENPVIGRQRNETAKNLFSIPAREHIVFYRYDSKHVYIVRVLHSRRDPRRAF